MTPETKARITALEDLLENYPEPSQRAFTINVRYTKEPVNDRLHKLILDLQGYMMNQKMLTDLIEEYFEDTTDPVGQLIRKASKMQYKFLETAVGE